ncbi:type VI secretion system ATPase TssH [bacterium SGD-2]|nr:type VI secretion system ATPase TssH [bacterium SGD-2]
MMLVELKPLFARLNPYCTASLEGAAGLTLARNHYEIAVEHMLRRLLDDPESDVVRILRHFEIDALRLAAQLDETLSQLRNGNPGRPVFATLLTEWVQEAWLVASITLGGRRIRSGAMLLSLIARLGYYGAGTLWVDTLRGISRDTLEREFDDITAGSPEVEQAAGDTPASVGPAAARGEDAISRFCEDFTAKAAAGRIDPVFGRDAEIRQMIDILARRRKNNPICVGEPGVGKTAVVEGLALRIVHDDVPEFLRGTRLLGLDMGLLEAGASVKGEFEKRLRGVIDEVKASSQPTILFIDEAHTLVGAGGPSGGSDAANLLKPALARGELRTIAATTWSEYKKYFEKDPALARRFQLVKLDEPDVPTAIQILRGLKDHYEAAHGVIVRDDAIVAAAELAGRYITGRLLPDKAVDLLDTAAARVRIGMGLKPAEVERLERQLAGLERERAALRRELSYAPGAHDGRLAAIEQESADLQTRLDDLQARWQQQKDAAEAVVALRRKVDESPDDAGLQAELQAARDRLAALQGDDPLIFIEVDPDAVARVVSDWTGVPLGKMQRDSVGSILALGEQIKTRIRGQDHAIDAIATAVKAAQSGLRDPRQPMGIFLLVGPSGVGKTETALAVADQLFGGEQALVSVNMSEFQEKHTVSRLVGSPPGYVGYGEGGILTEAVRKRPYSVVLLDEVEKAHPDVLNLFYQVFDKGVLSDGEGRIIDFSNTVVFLTSNLATNEIQALTLESRPDPDTVRQTIHPILAHHFKPALLARMTVVPYYSLPPAYLSSIVDIKLNRLAQRLAATNRIALEFAPEISETIAARCTEVDSGARNIDFILGKSLTPALADVVLGAMAQGRNLAALRVGVADDGGWQIDPEYAGGDETAPAADLAGQEAES